MRSARADQPSTAPASAPAATQPAAPTVRVSGLIAMDEAVVRQAAGTPPLDPVLRQAWGQAAILRIVQACKERQYLYARAWFRVNPDGSIRIHVDEGRMRVVFRGVTGVRALVMRLSLGLPNDIFHLPTLTRVLADLKQANRLEQVNYRVREAPEFEITPFDEAVPLRLLQIEVVSREKWGWGVDVGSSSTWGVLTGVGYQRRLWRDDQFQAKVQLAFPYRRYVFDEDPSFQWIHGGLEASYRLPTIIAGLAPRVDESLYLSRYARGDLDIKSYYLLRNTMLLNVVRVGRRYELALGGGADLVRASDATPTTDAPPDAQMPANETAVRGLVRLSGRYGRRSSVIRHDYRTYVTWRLDAASSDADHWFLAAEGSGQLFLLTHRHRFILRAHGLALAGDVRFWDEVPLANDFQRVNFANRFWVHQAAQVETAYRINTWWESVDVGLFHDFSLFIDRSRPDGRHGAWANGFGPSLHILLYELLALDVFLGFGFAPTGTNGAHQLGNSITFNLQTIF